MKKIAIIGAGISGLYFANLLQKNSDYDFTIFEKRSSLDMKNGYGIQLSVNSIKLLNQIGFNKIEILAICSNAKCKILFIFSILFFFNFHGSSSLIYLFVKKLIFITDLI